jgi:Sensors of blue-light using FAD
MPDCFSLVYQSVITPLLTAESLLNLLANSRRFNTTVDITGLMMMGNGRIMQFLEGPETKVRALYSRIKHDPRHTQVTLIAAAPATQREFPDWAMAYVRSDTQVEATEEDFDVSRLEFILGSENKLFCFTPASYALIASWLAG